MTNDNTILSAIEPELADTIVQGRRDVFAR